MVNTFETRGTFWLDAKGLTSYSGDPSSILGSGRVKRIQYSTRSISGVLTSFSVKLPLTLHWWQAVGFASGDVCSSVVISYSLLLQSCSPGTQVAPYPVRQGVETS